MGWDRLAGTGVSTAQKIVQRPTPFLFRHSASWLGGVPPMNNLPHDHVHIDEYTQNGATLLIIQYFWKALESLSYICPTKTWCLVKSRTARILHSQWVPGIEKTECNASDSRRQEKVPELYTDILTGIYKYSGWIIQIFWLVYIGIVGIVI